MSARIVWAGLAELRAALRALPADLRDEAGGIVEGAATAATYDMVTQYEQHHVTGKLAKSTKLEFRNSGQFGVQAVVRNTARHSHLFEFGTEARHTDLGYPRGAVAKSAPPGRVFVPAMLKHRRAMYDALRAVLVAHGLTVTGEP